MFATGVTKFRKGIAGWLGDADNRLSFQAIATMRELLDQLDEKDVQIDDYDARVARAANDDQRARRLMQVPVIGKLTATAVAASVGDPRHFPSSRDLSANLGLVPRQHSSGGKDRQFGITKRGDGYLRTLLIHCARAALRTAAGKPDRMLCWALQVQQRRGTRVAAVALANKLGRIVWALLANGGNYQPVPQRLSSAAGSSPPAVKGQVRKRW